MVDYMGRNEPKDLPSFSDWKGFHQHECRSLIRNCSGKKCRQNRHPVCCHGNLAINHNQLLHYMLHLTSTAVIYHVSSHFQTVCRQREGQMSFPQFTEDRKEFQDAPGCRQEEKLPILFKYSIGWLSVTHWASSSVTQVTFFLKDIFNFWDLSLQNKDQKKSAF